MTDPKPSPPEGVVWLRGALSGLSGQSCPLCQSRAGRGPSDLLPVTCSRALSPRDPWLRPSGFPPCTRAWEPCWRAAPPGQRPTGRGRSSLAVAQPRKPPSAQSSSPLRQPCLRTSRTECSRSPQTKHRPRERVALGHGRSYADTLCPLPRCSHGQKLQPGQREGAMPLPPDRSTAPGGGLPACLPAAQGGPDWGRGCTLRRQHLRSPPSSRRNQARGSAFPFTGEDTEVHRLIWQLHLRRAALLFFPTTAVHPPSCHLHARWATSPATPAARAPLSPIARGAPTPAAARRSGPLPGGGGDITQNLSCPDFQRCRPSRHGAGLAGRTQRLRRSRDLGQQRFPPPRATPYPGPRVLRPGEGGREGKAAVRSQGYNRKQALQN